VRGERIGEGVRISWVRRARRSGDSWDALEVPLNESVEAYRVEVLDNGATVRTIETTAPEALYTSVDELADFGAPQASLSVRVAQLSAVIGAGRARMVVLRL
jgi:hypothetical protein